MQIIKTEIEGLKIINLDLYKDDRGFFVERFNEVVLAKHGIDFNCIQVNHSFSVQNVVRGLHFQVNPAQKKLVGVTNGIIIDVAVDLRANSKTFGQHYKLIIDAPDTLLYIPEGFGHGFSVLSKEGANLLYVVEGNYNKAGDGGILYNDPALKIDWGVKNPIVSSKDLELPSLSKYSLNPLFK
jgi:dTDP-4-dehydrorhamnose 3,5-epimerase